MNLIQLHAAAVCAWFGLVAAETVMELSACDEASRRFVAIAHGWIDRVFEIPLLLTVLVSGAVLLSRGWPLSPLLQVKVVCGLIGVLANLVCIPLVQARTNAVGDDARVTRLTHHIILTGSAIPFGIAAMVIGFGHFA
ncbi:MAG: hypothetical protein JO006_09330 [Paucibacter sp.]|nr:hypothetical protein [Roseateles sp.]